MSRGPSTPRGIHASASPRSRSDASRILFFGLSGPDLMAKARDAAVVLEAVRVAIVAEQREEPRDA